MKHILASIVIAATACGVALAAEDHTADTAYRHGVIFTANTKNSIAESAVVKDGKFIYVGPDSGVARIIGPATITLDLKGRFMMPGIIDGHMHPLEAGVRLLHCSLNYESLTVPELQQRVQACLDQTKDKEPDQWLEVEDWFQENMKPAGVTTNRATLDVLKTQRPILIHSSFGHTALANSRAMSLAKFSAATQDPPGGKIWRDADGTPTGLLEDSAWGVFESLIPPLTPEQLLVAARKALEAMSAQGVTSFLDANAHPEDLATFSTLSVSHGLTARAHMAPSIETKENSAVAAAVARIVGYKESYDEGAITAAPSVTVRNAKIFLDGVIAAPALTGSVLEPYRRNAGTVTAPRWVAGNSRGPAVYFPPAALAKALIALGREGFDPHLHADGDGAVRAALNGIAALRKALPGADIRVAIAHDESVGAADFPRFRQLGAIPVLSLQWGKPAGDTLGLADYFGPKRMQALEPYGRLAAAGARIAFGSDWPVDALDEWFAFKVGVTRTNTPDSLPELHGRLGNDPGLTATQVLRAATINAAFELHQDELTGSIEVGKFADLIVLDRNPLSIAPEDIAHTKVLQTVVGGKTVYKVSL
jgi:predicted amidohydrolase YtcJ